MGIFYGDRMRNLVFPAKVFFHSAGFKELYGSIKDARTYSALNLMRSYDTLKDFDYVISVLWGNVKTQEKIMDIFGFSDTSPWPGNPDVSSYIMKNGIIRKENPIACGDSVILLGNEESLRRKCGSLEEYLNRPFKAS
jgi:hypothetical protein